MDTTEELIRDKAVLNQNGRIVIPAKMRERLGLKSGDIVHMSVEGDVLKVESHRARVRRVQESMKKLIAPGRSLADELIAERREESRREMEQARG